MISMHEIYNIFIKIVVHLSEIEKEFEKDPIPYRRVTTELKGDMRDFRLV